MKKEKTALAERENIVEEVGRKIEVLQKKGKLAVPPNYSPENALMSAWLVLQETQDKNKMPVLSSCTRSSIINSLLDMVIQGLNPAKDQCYFVPFGKKLTCMRSYFGSMTIVKNLAGAKDVYAEIIYDSDVLEYEIKNGNKKIITHRQRFGNINSEKIVGAYCVIVFDDREFTEIMTLEQIRKAWEKSKVSPEKEGSPHKEFPEEMCKRTVINRACKRYINSSSDNTALLEAFNRTDEVSTEEEVAEVVKKKANQEVIDIESAKEEEQGQQIEKVEPEKKDEPEQETEQKEEKSDHSPGF